MGEPCIYWLRFWTVNERSGLVWVRSFTFRSKCRYEVRSFNGMPSVAFNLNEESRGAEMGVRFKQLNSVNKSKIIFLWERIYPCGSRMASKARKKCKFPRSLILNSSSKNNLSCCNSAGLSPGNRISST